MKNNDIKLKPLKPILEDSDIIEKYTALNNELIDTKRELTKANIELKRMNEQKNKLLSITSHDLRGPLGAIRYFSESLAEQLAGRTGEDNIKMLKLITEQSNTMLLIIENLLDFTKIEDGNLELELKSVDMNILVRESINFNKLIASRKNITIEFLELVFPVIVTIDKSKIFQAFNNLIGNAIKFSINGSKITVQCNTDAGFAVISIIDKGIGISQAEITKIFEPYYVGSKKPTGGEPSTGLGLAYVDRIVNLHGGRVTVDSNPEQGSCFNIYIPLLAKTPDE